VTSAKFSRLPFGIPRLLFHAKLSPFWADRCHLCDRPGHSIDPVLAICGDRATEDVYRECAPTGPRSSVMAQYATIFDHLIAGAFGTSVITTRPVLSELLEVLPLPPSLRDLAFDRRFALGTPMGVARRFIEVADQTI